MEFGGTWGPGEGSGKVALGEEVGSGGGGPFRTEAFVEGECELGVGLDVVFVGGWHDGMVFSVVVGMEG